MIEAAETVLSARGRHAARRWKPFSLTAFKILGALEEHGLAPRTIIDGGANVGQFARAAAETFPEARVVAFEALPDIAHRLRTNLADLGRVEVRAVALGSVDGTIAFHRNDYSPASSALAMRADARDAFPQVLERDVLEVPVVRLDSALREDPLEPPVLLKLDLQGLELEALRGSQRTLACVQHVLLETTFQAMYEDEPYFDEVYSFMRAAGFRFVCPVDFLRDAQGRITQMDALFERTAASPGTVPNGGASG